MNPSYIHFKEFDIDSENIFSLNFSKENEIENVFLDKDYGTRNYWTKFKRKNTRKMGS